MKPLKELSTGQRVIIEGNIISPPKLPCVVTNS
jgi:hypothetical protein